MTVKRILEDAVVMGTPQRPAKIVVDDASSCMYVRCTFIWCEFLIAVSACEANPLFVNCSIEDTCTEVGEVPQLRLDHVAVGCSVHTPAPSGSPAAEGRDERSLPVVSRVFPAVDVVQAECLEGTSGGSD